MVNGIVGNGKFFMVLSGVDAEVAEQVRREGCPCGGVLHRADYPRKPRGEVGEAEALFSKRLSFCCAEDGCRKRATPPSLRFLGRKVYAGAIVLVASLLWVAALIAGIGLDRRIAGVPRRTVGRWHTWWTGPFVETAFWRAARARFVPPVHEPELPRSLVEKFALRTHDAPELARAVLEFVSPVTTGSAQFAMGVRASP